MCCLQILRGYDTEQMGKCLTLIQTLLTKSEELVTRINYLVNEVSPWLFTVLFGGMTPL